MTQASPTKSILISSPDSISISNHRLEFLTLPHPKSSIPTYFLPTSSTSTTTSTSSQHSQSKHDQSRSDYLEREQNCDEILELKVIRPEKGQRSWFVATTPKELQQDDDSEGKQQQQQHESDFGQVIGDGALHTLSPMDPIFLLLAMFKPSKDSESTRFIPAEDFFETASSNLYRSRIRSQNEAKKKDSKMNKGSSKEVGEQEEEEGSWEDVIRFGNTKAAIDALGRISDTQDLTSTMQVYRPSTSKVLSILNTKLDQLSSKELFQESPNTLDRILARSTDEGSDEETLSKARRKIAKDVLGGYLAKDWLDLLED